MARSTDYPYANYGWTTTPDDYPIYVSRMEQMPSNVTDFPHYPPNYGWNTTPEDYSIHVSRMEQLPSNVPDFPHYPPNIHTIVKETLTIEEQGNPIYRQKQYHGAGQDDHKKVRFAEHKKITTQVVNNNIKGKENAVEDQVGVDSEADGFIQKKHKYFDMCKTFNAY